jgi:hypothetical protein
MTTFPVPKSANTLERVLLSSLSLKGKSHFKISRFRVAFVPGAGQMPNLFGGFGADGGACWLKTSTISFTLIKVTCGV